MKQVLKYVKPYIGFLIVILLAKLAAAVLELMIPSALGDILDIAAPSGSVPSGRSSRLTRSARVTG